MKKYRKNQWGFSHHFILPVLAFVAVGAIGAYVIAQSSAATAGPSDVVYSTHLKAGGEKYYRYSSSAATSTEYSSDTKDIVDVSKDQKWVLIEKWQGSGEHTGTNEYVALSNSGEKISYGYFAPYYSYEYDGDSCSVAATVTRNALFSKVSTTAAPKLYYVEGNVPCESGKYNNKKITHKVYSIDANGANKKAISATLSSDINNTVLLDTATNGNYRAYIKDRDYILSAAGKILFKSKDAHLRTVYLSENGKKITYTEEALYPAKVYVADANGKKAKKVMSYTSQNSKMITGISPTGAYLTYQKSLSKDGKKSGLYAFKVSNKKSYTIDSGYNWQSGIPGALTQERWLPGSNTLVYSKVDAKAKTVQIIQVGATGSGKKVLAAPSYDTIDWVTLF